MSQNDGPVAPLGPKGRAAVAETLLGPKGLIAAIFKNEKGIVVPTYAEVKKRRANPQEPGPVAAKTIALLNTALKAVDKSAAKGGLPAAQSALLAQMKKMVDAANKEGGKGAKLLSQLYKKATSLKKGGAPSLPPGGAENVADLAENAIAIPAEAARQLRGDGAIRTALNRVTMRYTALVAAGLGHTEEARALAQTIAVFNMILQENERRRQWLNRQHFHQIMPYIVNAMCVAAAAAVAYHMVSTIEGAAGFVLGVGAGILRVLLAGVVDILNAANPARLFGYGAVDGHDAVDAAVAAARNYTGDDFEDAAREAERIGFGAKVTAGFILFLIFCLTMALVAIPFQDREWGLGYGLVRVGRRGNSQNDANNPFLHPAPAPAPHALGAPAAVPMIAAPAAVPMIAAPPAAAAPAAVPMIAAPPAAAAPAPEEQNQGNAAAAADVDGGGKRRRRRRTKKRRKKRKGRSRKRVKRKRRSTRKRRRNRRRHRTRSRR